MSLGREIHENQYGAIESPPMTTTLARSVLHSRRRGVEVAEAKVLLAIANNQAAILEGHPVDGDLIDEFKAAARLYELAVGSLNQAQAEVDATLRKESNAS